MTSKELISTIQEICKSYNFTLYKKHAAYKATEHTIFTVSFFKSRFGNLYIINLKLDIKGYNKNETYELNSQFFSHDLGDMMIDSDSLDRSYLNLEDYDYSDDERIAAIKEMFSNYIHPLSERLGSLNGVKEYIIENGWEYGCDLILDFIRDYESRDKKSL